MFTTDAHCDTLYGIIVEKKSPENCIVTIENLQKGGVMLQTFAMFTSFRRKDPYADGVQMKELYKTLQIKHLDSTLPDEIPTEISGILSCEGGEMLRGSIDILREFDDDVHMRLLALTWNYDNEIGTPAAVDATTGLKTFGFELLKEMDRRGIAADVSHLNEAGFWDVVENTQIPPIASHSDCRWLCNHKRNLTKEQVRALIDRNGFIGMNFYPYFLTGNETAEIDDVVRHIDAICEMGGEEILGFGSDFDGIEVWPNGLKTPADFPTLIERLRNMGYRQETLEKIAGLNYWRYLKTAESYRTI